MIRTTRQTDSPQPPRGENGLSRARAAAAATAEIRYLTAGLAVLLSFGGAGCETPTYHRLFDDIDGGYLVIGNPGGGGGGDASDSGTGPNGDGGISGSGGVGGPLTTGGTSGSGTGGGPTTVPPAGTGGVGAAGAVGGGGSGAFGSGGVDGVGSGGNVVADGTGGVMETGAAGSGGSNVGSGGARSLGTGGGSSGGASADTARYSFEQSTQAWGAPSGSPALTSVTTTGVEHFAGQSSLAAAITTDAARKFQVGIALTTTSPGAGVGVTYHVLVPVGAPIAWIQPYVKTGAPGYTWTGVVVSPPGLKPGQWTTIVVTVPAASPTIRELGVQLNVTAAWTGTVYVDSVTW